MIQLELINDYKLAAPELSQFSAWIARVSEILNTQGEVCIKIIDETESQDLNHRYRGKDFPTNVLSFPSEIPDFVEATHLGDLAICAPVVEREANEQAKIVTHHWAHLAIHGVLHLLGFDHVEDADAEKMEALEVEILADLGIENPYIF